MKKFTCQYEGCEMMHCPRCGRHYEPCRETARANKCDGCIIGDASDEMERITEAFGGNYEEAARFYGW